MIVPFFFWWCSHCYRLSIFNAGCIVFALHSSSYSNTVFCTIVFYCLIICLLILYKEKFWKKYTINHALYSLYNGCSLIYRLLVLILSTISSNKEMHVTSHWIGSYVERKKNKQNPWRIKIQRIMHADLHCKDIEQYISNIIAYWVKWATLKHQFWPWSGQIWRYSATFLVCRGAQLQSCNSIF